MRMIDSKTLKQFQVTGRMLMELGLNNSHSGNLSVLAGRTICITRTGARLGALEWPDVVAVPLDFPPEAATQASRELVVHRRIYLETPHKAVVHAHPPCTVALSMLRDIIEPADAEGRYYQPRVPVLKVRDPIGSEEVAAALPRMMRTDGGRAVLVVVRGHGTFAAAATLDEALKLTSSLEASCRILHYLGGFTR